VKKSLFSIVAVVLCLGIVGSSYAYFTDVETSLDNTFTAGTLGLEIWDGSSWGDAGPVAEWTMSDMTPGVNSASGKVDLREVGSITPHHLEITCSYTATEGPPTGDADTVDQNNPSTWDDFAKYIEITYLDYYDSSWHIKYDTFAGFYTTGSPPNPSGWVPADWQITDSDGVSGISLYDLLNDPLDNLPPPDYDTVGDVHFEMTVRFHEDAGNDLQGDILNLTMIFTLNQDVSQ